MMPPLAKSEKAACCGPGVQSATTDSPSGMLLMWRPSGFFGPHPKQTLLGEYLSWRFSDGSNATPRGFFSERFAPNK